jgi:hypothetical protein
MKRSSSVLLTALLGLFILQAPLMAQKAQARPGRPAREEARAIIKALDISPDDMQKIEAVLAKDEAAIARKRGDVKVAQTQIARLLLEANPQIDQIGALVKQAQAAEYDLRMMQISRQIEVKKIIGDRRWAILYRFATAAGKALKAGKLKEAFSEGRLDKAQLEAWRRLLSYARRLN